MENFKTIEEARNVCVSKTDMEKCRTSETKMENLFNDGNSKLAVYKDEKSNVIAMENDYHKAGMGDSLEKMENAKKTMSADLQNLKSQQNPKSRLNQKKLFPQSLSLSRPAWRNCRGLTSLVRLI